MHASCAARHGQGVLILGPAGSGKSSLILSLLHSGFMLVADDQVIVTDGRARCPDALAGLLAVRGAGIARLPYLRGAQIRLMVDLGAAESIPRPSHHLATGIPLLRMDRTTAPDYIAVAMSLAPRVAR